MTPAERASDPTSPAGQGPGPSRPAYLLSRFPLLSETFILRELAELHRRGCPVTILPLIDQRAPVVHREVAALSPAVVSLRLSRAATLGAIASTLARRPGRSLGAARAAWWGNSSSPRFLLRSLVVAPKALAAARVVARTSVTHLHAHYGTHPALLAWMVHRITGLPYSVTVHSHDLDVDRTMLDRKLGEAAFVVAVSEHHRDFLRRHLGDAIAAKTSVIRCGVEPERYRAATAQRDPAAPLEIVSVGSLQPYKGYRYLIDALALLTAGGSRFRCRIAGGGPLEPELRRRIGEAGLASSVQLLGPLRQDEVAALLPTAHCYVQPSIVTPEGKQEGLPVALMEALACELPVVATDVGAVSELVRPGETGSLVPPGDAAALARAIASLERDWDAARARARAGRALVEREFDLRRSVDRLERLFARATAPATTRSLEVVATTTVDPSSS